MSYAVFDNNMPASCAGFPCAKEWSNHVFQLRREAVDYALQWLGSFAPPREVLECQDSYDYSGYGDVVEIREVHDNGEVA